jgi:hypothetical protein
MFSKTKIALAAVLVAGSATLALADDYTDIAADALRNNGPVAQQQFVSQHVALPKARANSDAWMERASQTESGGGY